MTRLNLKQLYKDLHLLKNLKKTRKSRTTAFGIVINCDNTTKNINSYYNLLDTYIDNQSQTKRIEEQLTNVERGLIDIGCSKDKLKQLYNEYKSKKSEKSEKRKPFGDVSNVVLPSINKVSKYQNSIWHQG